MANEVLETITPDSSEKQDGLKCENCGKILEETEARYFEGEEKGSKVCLCNECVTKFNYEFEEATKNVNWLRGTFYGIGAGLICGVIWYWLTALTNTVFSIAALGVGFAVAIAVSMGSGNKKGLLVQMTSAFLTLVTLYLSTGLIAAHQMAQGQGLLEFYMAGGAVDTVAKLVATLLGPFYVLDFIGWLICFVGIYIAFITPQKESLKEIK